MRKRIDAFFDARRRAQENRKAQAQADRQVEIERILEKISETGIGSLTNEEKAALNRASEEMRRSR